MNKDELDEDRAHHLTLTVFSISAAMIGVCLTAIGILRVVSSQTRIATFGDELLVADAALFAMCCGLAFWSFKTRTLQLRQFLRALVDALFLTSLLILVAVCAVIAYAIA